MTTSFVIWQSHITVPKDLAKLGLSCRLRYHSVWWPKMMAARIYMGSYEARLANILKILNTCECREESKQLGRADTKLEQLAARGEVPEAVKWDLLFANVWRGKRDDLRHWNEKSNRLGVDSIFVDTLTIPQDRRHYFHLQLVRYILLFPHENSQT